MILTEMIPFLKAEKPLDILWRVITYNQKIVDNKKLLTVRMALTNTNVVEGVPINIDHENNVVVLILERKSISYVTSNHLISIEILHPELILDKLTGGEYLEVPVNKVPTVLELKRKFNEIENTLNRTYAIKLTSDIINDTSNSDKTKFQFSCFIEILSNSLNDIAKDSLGNEALLKLSEIHIKETNKETFVAKGNDQLLIHINFGKNFPAQFEQELKKLIEEKL
ncbi:hypothetical protein [Flavivirga spongiicola]|uniref:Uncharacterized protein n=1 Tax=Flavivirga spongiicola TaxID=421621 RepID=A0ABU7XNJ3_9FLAO|nr:hypothetical protein [Flavivirga sp. MEBiC05379]MDO5977335.1 hypothetical protein [Flavivirga sp. MEBiC05379]